MAKLALCIKKSDVLAVHSEMTDNNLFIYNEFHKYTGLKAGLISRVFAETDDNYLQLIPYIVLRNEDNKYFAYMRGSSGNEGRLHGNVSIGLGGHVEEEPDEFDLEHVFYEAARRELEEEVGLKISRSELMRLTKDITTVLYNPINEVGRVHLAVIMVIDIQSLDIKQLEEGVITKGQWLTLNELISKHDAKEMILEDWSLQFVHLLARANK